MVCMTKDLELFSRRDTVRTANVPEFSSRTKVWTAKYVVILQVSSSNFSKCSS